MDALHRESDLRMVADLHQELKVLQGRRGLEEFLVAMGRIDPEVGIRNRDSFLDTTLILQI